MDQTEAQLLENRVAEYSGHRTMDCRQRVVLAASGGADSTAMVALLCEAGIVSASNAIVAHFDHCLREAAAARRDLHAVSELCDRYGLSLETGAWDAPRRGEAAARQARYAFLRAIAMKFGARAIVTGHTSNDQVETVLMHMLRGAGLHGLAGMGSVAALPIERDSNRSKVEVWRPLLGVLRAETRAYCAARGLAYHDDVTNEDRGLTRNRVRLELLPLLEWIVPDARAALMSLSMEAREHAVKLDAIAASAIITCGGNGGAQEVTLSRDALLRLGQEAVPHAFRIALTRLLGDARDFGRVHYEMLAHAVSARTGSTIELPRGVVATVDAAEIVLWIGAPGPAPIASDFVAALPYAGHAGLWAIEATAESGRVCGNVDAITIRLPDGAVLRGRRPGDRVALAGGGHKKLQDLYVDAKVPRRERDAAPVIACGSDVLWTPVAARRIATTERGRVYRLWARREGSRRVTHGP